jgi:hypothetical protein
VVAGVVVLVLVVGSSEVSRDYGMGFMLSNHGAAGCHRVNALQEQE